MKKKPSQQNQDPPVHFVADFMEDPAWTTPRQKPCKCGSTLVHRDEAHLRVKSLRGRRGTIAYATLECAACEDPDLWLDFMSVQFDLGPLP